MQLRFCYILAIMFPSMESVLILTRVLLYQVLVILGTWLLLFCAQNVWSLNVNLSYYYLRDDIRKILSIFDIRRS